MTEVSMLLILKYPEEWTREGCMEILIKHGAAFMQKQFVGFLGSLSRASSKDTNELVDIFACAIEYHFEQKEAGVDTRLIADYLVSKNFSINYYKMMLPFEECIPKHGGYELLGKWTVSPPSAETAALDILRVVYACS